MTGLDAFLPRRDLAALLTLVIAGVMLSALDGGSAAYGLVVVAFAAALISPASAVVAIAAAIPFVQDPVAIGSSNWNVLELSILFATASVGLRVLLDLANQRSLHPIWALLRPRPTITIAALMVVCGAATLFNLADPRFRPDSVRELRWVLVEPAIALVLFRWAIRQGRRFALVGCFIGTGALVALYGLFQLLTGDGVVIADGVQRATGPFEHPNNLALYLDRVAILALGVALATPKMRRRLAGVAVFCAIGLVATLSRGAGIAFIAGGMIVAAFARVRHAWRWIAAVAAVAVLAIGLLGAQRLTDSGSSGSTSSRELIWRSSIEMIRDHPITGIGLDQFLNQYGRRYVEPAGWPERYTSHPHNIVLDFWLRLGLPGLACLALLIGWGARLIYRLWRGEDRDPIRIGAAGALVAGLAHGLVDNSFFLPDLAVMTWLLFALLEPIATRPSADS